MSSTGYGTRRVRIPGVSRDVENVLLWRDAKVSGSVFVASTLLYLLLEWSGLSLLTIVSNTLLGLVSIAFLWNNVANFTGKSGVPLPAIVDRGVSDSDLKYFAESFTAVINKGLGFTRRLISGKDIILTVEVAAALYVFGKIGNFFSSLGLLYTLAVLAFTVPKLYELKKDDIDNAVSTAQTHGKKHYSNYVEPYVKKIPRGSTSSTNTSSAPSGLSGADNGPSGPNNNNFSAPNSNFGGGNNTLGGNTNFGGPNSGSRPNTFESEADSFTNIGRDAAAGISSEGKKLT